MNNKATEAFSEPEDVGVRCDVGVPTDMLMKQDTEEIRTGTCKFNKSYHEALVQVCVHVPPLFQNFYQRNKV
jgi:hypothetical protein